MIYFFMIVISCLIAMNVKNVDGKMVAVKYKVISSNKRKIKDIFHTIMSAVPPFLMSALRYGIGTDYLYGYVPIFYWVRYDNPKQKEVEEGYILLNKLVAFYTDNYQWIFVLTSFIYIACVFYALYKSSKKIWYSVLLFFLSYNYFNSYNIIRQEMAMAIILVGLTFLQDEAKIKDYVKFIVLVLIASTLHRTALISLLFPIVMNIKVDTKYILVFSIFGLFMKNTFIELFIGQAYFLHQRYLVYAGNISHSELPIQFLVFNSIFLALMLYLDYKNKDLRNDKHWNTAKWMQFIAVFSYSVQGMIPYVTRMALYFTFPQIIYLPNILVKHGSKVEKRWMYGLVTLVFLIDFLYNYFMGFGEIRPYPSIFNK